MARDSASDLVVRTMPFEYPPDMDPICAPGNPEMSYNMLGFSMTMPYLEPYLIRSMKEALPLIKDERIADDVRKFSAQEGQHYRQHMKMNDVVRSKSSGNVRAIEDRMEADYQRFTKTKSLKWNLAYAEGFEAMTTAWALSSLVDGTLEMLKGTPAFDIFEWHLTEELEHRTVAFEAYHHLYGGYWYRLVVGFYAQMHFMLYVDRFFKCLLKADVQSLAKYGGMPARRKRLRQLGKMFFASIVPRMLRTYKPSYHPKNLEIPEKHHALSRKYSETALKTA